MATGQNIKTSRQNLTAYRKMVGVKGFEFALNLSYRLKNAIIIRKQNGGDKMQYSEWLKTWLETYTLNIKRTTFKHYTSVINTHLHNSLGRYNLEDITLQLLQEFYTQKYRNERVSPKTLRNINGVVHESLRVAVELGLIDSNPADKVRLPKVSAKAIHPFSSDEIKQLMELWRFHRFGLLYLFALYTGAREGEILGLTWDCVDLSRKTVVLEKQLSYFGSGEGWQFNSLKNNKVRTVSLPDFLAERLAEEKKEQHSHTANRLNLVFINKENGDHLRAKTVINDFKALAEKVGRPNARFHDLRHTYATNCLELGDSIKTVQSNLGHATASFTLATYTHVSSSAKIQSARKLDELYYQLS
ncbi:MAG: site-specific integrase [Oscillospiraceae bacterium]|nr:site-specific integrase [Oscillospiraceae bacterium]